MSRKHRSSIAACGLLAAMAWEGRAEAAGIFHWCRKDDVPEAVQVDRLVRTMLCDPNWRARDDAAHDLRKFDWEEHPEMVDALLFTLQRDPEEEVREESAETLAKLAPCVPEAHVVLAQSAASDPDPATRKWARRGLAKLSDRCDGDCQPSEFVLTGRRKAPPGYADLYMRLPETRIITPIPPESIMEPGMPVPYGEPGWGAAPPPVQVAPGLEPTLPSPMMPYPSLPPAGAEPPLELVPPELPPASVSPFSTVPSPYSRRPKLDPRGTRTAMSESPERVVLWEGPSHAARAPERSEPTLVSISGPSAPLRR